MDKYRKRAWADTYRQLGGGGFVIAVLIIPPVGFFIHWLFRPADMMGEVEIWVIYGLASTGVVFLSLFAINLACAPYRIERDERLKEQISRLAAEEENRHLKAKIEGKPKRRRLSPEQQAVLTSAIRKSGIRPENIPVVFYRASEECADFAEDIGAAIRASGVESLVHDGIFYDHATADRGIKIVSDKRGVTRELANAIEQSFKEIGQTTEWREGKDKGHINIYVARSSDAE